MDETRCPECDGLYDTGKNRQIKEACGHDKCRQCLLSEENGCQQCQSAYTDDPEPEPDDISAEEVIVFEEEQEDQFVWVKVDSNEPEATIEHREEDDEEEEPAASEMELVQYEDVEIESAEQDASEEDARPSPTPSRRQGRTRKSKPADGFAEHIKKLANSKYECTICGRVVGVSSVTYHTYCDPSIPMPYSCSKCGRHFRTIDHYRYHEATHRDDSRKCQFCEKAFRNQQTLNTHVRMAHSGIPAPYTCPDCKKEFFALSKYKLHVNMHTNELPYNCPVCFKAFRLKENMVKHGIVHTQEKPYCCEVCQVGFKRPDAYRKHMERAHQANRPEYKCEVCGEVFTHPTVLRRHLLKHHEPELEYQCLLCAVSCSRKDNLMRHIKAMHTDGEASAAEVVKHIGVGGAKKSRKGRVKRDTVDEEDDGGDDDNVTEQVEVETTFAEAVPEDDQELRKNSVIIYVGPPPRPAGEQTTTPSSVSTSMPPSGLESHLKGTRKRGLGGGGPIVVAPKTSKSNKVEKEFSQLTSDHLELYRKILSRDADEVEVGRKGKGPGWKSSRSGVGSSD